MLRLQKVKSGYVKNHEILTGLDLNVAKGEVIAIVGQNGAGKTTLAKAIMGLMPYVDGDILLQNTNINGLPTHKITLLGLGYLMQGGQVFPHLTVNENLRVAAGTSTRVLNDRLFEMREHFDFLKSQNRATSNRPASYLSGGERHQLALAMVMIRKPKLIILDEPSAGLSPANTDKLYQLLSTLKKSESITTVIIEQNILKAVQFSDKVLLLRNGMIVKAELSKHLEKLDEISDFVFN